jgi:glutamine cyclotransferase
MNTPAYLILLLFLITGCSGINENSHSSENAVEQKSLGYEVRMTLMHDPHAFTQGLVFYKDKLIESTGGDSSWIAVYDVVSGHYDKKVRLPSHYFGEGITVLNDKLYQLTWKSKIGFVYDVNTFKQIGEFSYDFEGWGLTHDHQHLIISDGTDQLHYFDTLSLTEVFSKSIKRHNRKASKLNELEFMDGYIYANQWHTNTILKIDPATSAVVDELDLGYLAREIKRTSPDADVLNGIAYNPGTKDFLITGKLWPHLYVLRLKE